MLGADARQPARTRTADAETRADLAALGAPAAVRAAAEDGGPGGGGTDYGVWPENWDAVEVFEASQTQWRFAGMAGVPTGLDMAGVRATCAFLDKAPSRDLLERLRVMEAEALSVWADGRAERRGRGR